MDVGGVGRRIAYWRERRGLTQEQLGALMGLSRRAVQDIEAGARQADPRLSLLERAAEALSIRIEQLLSEREAPARECVDEAEIGALRAVLHRPATHYPDTASAQDAPLAVVYGWNAFQAAHYSSLGRLLPGLIVQAHAAPQDAGVLSTAYQLASATMLKFGDPTSAMIAADRAIATASRQDPVVQACAARRYSDALTGLGDGAAAQAVALETADRLAADLEAAGAAGWSVYGMLLLKSVMGAAGRGDAGTVRTLLAQAGQIAERLGGDANHAWSAFGPTNVRLYEVSAMVVLGDGAAAVTAASAIGREQLEALPRERRAQLLMDLAAGHALTGRADSALLVLLAAERLAPQEVHCRALSRALVSDLMRVARPLPEHGLRGLAARCGLAP